MGDAKNNNEEMGKGFVVRDKRFSAEKEAEGESKIKEEGKRQKEEAKEEEASRQDIPLPEINFTNFIFSLSTSALIQLGEIQDPLTQQQAKNLPLAKQTIDLIGMLKEKTKGNLTPDEEKLTETVLYDLRMRYVIAAS
jgi:hypothetical protein